MPKRILLADDSITIQKVVELTFSDGDYEVTAVNNGAKAIQKLSEMRPDIILSDIIMPEKNGYEVCEYVKSHPDFRNLPVILLTGTFEPFDPDRADKAGCDAVVTKPFESQSLIQKVEELIQASKAAAPAAAAPAPPQAPQPFATAAFPPSAPPAPSFQPHGSEIFAAPTTEVPPPAPMPFAPPPAAPPAFGGETRAFPPMSFGDLQAPTTSVPPPPPMESSPWDEPAEKEPASSGLGSGFPPMSSTPAAPAAPEPSPWDEPAPGGETRAFGKVSFDDLQGMAGESATPPPAPPPPAAEPSPWGAPEAESGETRAMPRMSFDELQSLSQPAPSQPEASPWDQPAPAPDAGATNAFPPMSFGGFNAPPAAPEAPAASSESMWGSSQPSDSSSSEGIAFGGGHVPEPEPASEPSPWDAPHEEFSGETTAFPKMSFDDLRKMAEPEHHAPEPEAPSSSSWNEEPPQAPSWPSDALSESRAQGSAMAGGERAGDLPAAFGSSEAAESEVEAKGTPGSMADHSESHEWAAPAPAMAAGGERSSDLSDDQIDKIARRVVQLMSDTVVRNIAWEVIPDLAEMVVKERIRQLESE